MKIVHSRWLAELSERELSQPRYYPYPWQDFQHFMFTFNDALVEVIAEGFAASELSGSVEASLQTQLGSSD